MTRQAKLVVGVTAGLVLSGIGSAVVLASVPDSNGVIHACYRSTGALASGQVRIIDDATQTCNSSETAITWNQTGPQGPVGPPGPAGTSYFGLPFICSGCDFINSGDLLANKDLSDAWMPSATFGTMNLENTNFSEAHLKSLVLRGNIFFQNTNFSNAELGSMRFALTTDRNLTGAIFTGAKLEGATLNQANLSGVDFSNASMIIAHLDNSNASSANFSNANMSQINFVGTNLTGANFSGTYLGTPEEENEATWSNVTCPDGTNSDNNGNTCLGHLTP